MKRADLQAMAQSKFDDALLLYKNKRYANAYYLAGYAVELGLKAVAAQFVAPEVIPDKKWVQQIYTHDIKSLVRTVGLMAKLEMAKKSDPEFAANWAIVEGWSEDARYEMIDRYGAQALLGAVGSEPHGALIWLKQHW